MLTHHAAPPLLPPQVQTYEAFASGRSLRSIAEDPARLRPLKLGTVSGYVVDCVLFAAFGGSHADAFMAAAAAAEEAAAGRGAAARAAETSSWRTAAASARCAPLLAQLRRAVSDLGVGAAAQCAIAEALLRLCSGGGGGGGEDAPLPAAHVGPHHVRAVPPRAVMDEVGGRHNDHGIGWEHIKLVAAAVTLATVVVEPRAQAGAPRQAGASAGAPAAAAAAAAPAASAAGDGRAPAPAVGAGGSHGADVPPLPKRPRLAAAGEGAGAGAASAAVAVADAAPAEVGASAVLAHLGSTGGATLSEIVAGLGAPEAHLRAVLDELMGMEAMAVYHDPRSDRYHLL